jgi:hypothetical protein
MRWNSVYHGFRVMAVVTTLETANLAAEPRD